MKDASQPACPHCGEPLPEIVDAFCPECRGPLEEVPVPPPVEQRVHRDPLRNSATLLMFLGGVCLLGTAAYVVAALMAPYFSRPEELFNRSLSAALVLLVLGVVLLVAGARLKRPGRPR